MTKKNNELIYNTILFVVLTAFVIVGFKYVTNVENSSMVLTTEENLTKVLYSCENEVSELGVTIIKLEQQTMELQDEIDNYDNVVCFNKSF